MGKFQRSDRGARPAPRGLLPVVVITSLCLASAPNAAVASRAHAGRPCRAPLLTGLTLEVARVRAKHAGCGLISKGAPIETASIQTVERQSPAVGRRSSHVAVWLNPACGGSAAPGPGVHEPTVTVGPTGLVSGFYLDGGPAIRFSSPGCKRPEPKPGAGIVEVSDASSAVVADVTSARGRFVEIPLTAGSYTIAGTFLEATINEVHPTQTESLVIPAGHSVRQDFVLSIP